MPRTRPGRLSTWGIGLRHGVLGGGGWFITGRFLDTPTPIPPAPAGPGHALALLDTVALLPLLAGTSWLYAGLWQRRGRLTQQLCAAPASSSLVLVTAGFGVGLLVASVLSQFFWWWAVGAVLLGGMLLGAVVIAARAE